MVSKLKLKETNAYKIGYSVGYNKGVHAAQVKNSKKANAPSRDFIGWHEGVYYIHGIPMPKPML